MAEYTTVEEQAEYGLDAISSDRTVEVSLRDLFYVYQVLGEFVRFFHQPNHYPDIESIEKFLGTPNEGGFRLLAECYFQKMRDMWPEDIIEKIENSTFQHPSKPYYYQPVDEADKT